MMSEKRCVSCKFWKKDELEYQGRLYPACKSPAVHDDCRFVETFSPKSFHGCIRWQAKPEDDFDLMGQIAEYLFHWWCRKWKSHLGFEDISAGFKNELLDEANEILAIVQGEDDG
jgi:hypothetical protein